MHVRATDKRLVVAASEQLWVTVAQRKKKTIREPFYKIQGHGYIKKPVVEKATKLRKEAISRHSSHVF